MMAKLTVIILILLNLCFVTAAFCANSDEKSDILARVSFVENVLKKVETENENLRQDLKITKERLLEAEEDIRILKSVKATQPLGDINGRIFVDQKQDTRRDEAVPIVTESPTWPRANETSIKEQENGHQGMKIKVKRQSSIQREAGRKDPHLTGSDPISKRLLVNPTGLESTPKPQISFSVHLSGHHLTGLGQTETLVFDIVDNNDGNAYDKTSGMFICPESGTYFFTGSLLCWPQVMVDAEIVLNGAVKSRLYAAGSTGSHGFDQGSSSVILSCNKGDHVWMRHLHGDDKVRGYLYSHFAGFILW